MWPRFFMMTACLPGSLLLWTALIYGQTASPDEGTFRVFLADREVGSEVFSIRRSGTGQSVLTIAEGRLQIPGGEEPVEIRSLLEVAPLPARQLQYQADIRGEQHIRIASKLTGRRFSNQTVSGTQEEQKEFLVEEPALLMESGLAHHMAFLAPLLAEDMDRLTIMVPQENRIIAATLAVDEPEPIQLNGQQVQARKLSLTGDSMSLKQVWLDMEGRVLKVAIPDRDYLALRRTPPR